MLKISEYELMELLLLINKDTSIESDVDAMLKSKNPLSNKVGKIMNYMSFKTISDIEERIEMYANNEEVI